MHSFTNFFLNLFILLSFIIISLPLKAQNNSFGYWNAWFNNLRFNQKWGMNNDIQFRAGRNWGSNSLLLIRPGINYYVNSKQTASLGYATTFVTNPLNEGQYRFTEHRIWEQYIIMGKVAHVPVQHRFRLEQRFLQRPEESVFSQRARYFIRAIIPLTSSAKETFLQGPFTALQNELFMNIHNKEAVNGNLFDQNRLYLAIGYRFSAKYDLEMGYMNQFLKRKSSPDQFTHIAQLAFYSRF